MLKQILFQKCFSGKIAVPFIHVLHDFSSQSSRSVVSIWPLRSLHIQNRYVNNEAKSNLCVEEGVFEHPTNLVTFARIGKTANSKSEMLNWLLSNNDCKTFFNKNCIPQITCKKYSEGLVEIFWLPMEGKSKDRFNNPVTFLNCRGSLHLFQSEILDFVSKLTDILVVLLDIKTLHELAKNTDNYLSKFSSMLIIVDNPMIPRVKPIMDEFRSKLQAQRKSCEFISTYQREETLKPIKLTGILQGELKKLLIKLQPLPLDTRIKSCSKNIDFDEDSSPCKDGEKRAQIIIDEMLKAGSSLKWKTVITPVQTTISKSIAEYIQKQQRLEYETEIKVIDEKLHSLRQSCLNHVTSTLKKFAFHLCMTNISDLSLQYFLGWLNIMLKNIKLSTVQKLQNQCNLDIEKIKSRNLSAINFKQEVDMLLKGTEDIIEKSSFSIDHLFREVSHIYDVLLILKRKSDLPSVDKMKATFAELIYIGYPFELVDGDNSFLPTQWVNAILLSLSQKIDNKGVLTISVVGLQSSGKSTLLNTMFGSHFAVSSGRCTKGLNLQLIPMSQRITKQSKFSYVLVVDTEGLRAAELSDRNFTHDNELATFITGLGDVTILNVMGENICEITDILNVTVHAFIRLKKANKSLDIRKSCYFVHQNVRGILTEGQTRPGLRKLVQKLNDATKNAAQLESVSDISEFTQIMEFDMKSQVFYMPTLWQGNSPMTFVNCEYSEKVNDVKNMVLQGACEMTNKSYKSLKDLVIHMNDLWMGVLCEDFVFSFRNNIEIKAYIHLNEHFKEKHSMIKTQIYDACCVSAKNTFSKSIDTNKLKNDFDKAKSYADKTIDDEEENWKQEMDDFFRKSNYSAEQIQWKGKTMTRIVTSCLELKKSIESEMSALFNDRAVEILTTMNKTRENDLITKCWKVAKELKGNFPDKKINEKFEGIWTDTASQSLMRNIGEPQSIDIKKILYDSLHDFFDQNKPLLKKSYDSRDVNTVIDRLQGSVEYLCIDPSELPTCMVQKLHFWSRNIKMRMIMKYIKERIEKMFKTIDDTLMQLQNNEDKIAASDVILFFEHVKKFYKGFEKEIECDIKLKIRIFLQISECAGNVFEKHNKNYEMNFGLKARCHKYKEKMKEIFMSFLKTRKAEETAAFSFSDSVESSVRDSVIKVLTEETKHALCSHIGSMKYHFIINLLSDLLRRNDYKAFTEYNFNPKLFAAQWITERSNKFLFCKPSRKYYSMACSYVTEYFDDIKATVVKTAAKMFSDCESKEISYAPNDWIDKLSSNLQKCTISNSKFDLVKNILQQKIDQEKNDQEKIDLENFKELIIRKLDESEHKLKEEFEKVDSTTVTWKKKSEGLDPITEVINEIWGCPEECPFCGEPCALDIHDAEKECHYCIQHKPKGCKGVHFSDSKQLSITTCNFAVSSTDLTHKCGVFDYACKSGTEKKACPLEEHRYRDYKQFIKNWDIQPKTDMNEVCKFWMLYLSRFAKDITKDSDIEISEIPASWQNISDEDAIESLRKFYK